MFVRYRVAYLMALNVYIAQCFYKLNQYQNSQVGIAAHIQMYAAIFLSEFAHTLRMVLITTAPVADVVMTSVTS